jgi:uncharacterized protein YcfJ
LSILATFEHWSSTATDGVHVMQIQVFSAAKDVRKDIESRSSVMTISDVKLIGYDILHFWGVSERTVHFSQKSKNRFGMDTMNNLV